MGKTTPLTRPVRDSYGFEHDVISGPCACGAWHNDEYDYFWRLGRVEVQVVLDSRNSDDPWAAK